MERRPIVQTFGGRINPQTGEFLEDMTELEVWTKGKATFIKVSSQTEEGLNLGLSLELEYEGTITGAPQSIKEWVRSLNK